MDFVLNLEYSASVPPFRRLSDALRNAILDGRLAPGGPLPSVRDLSATLHISRATVLKAFDDLKRQGYLETAKGSGTLVRKRLPGDLSDLIAQAQAIKRQSTKNTNHVKLSSYGQQIVKQVAAGQAPVPWAEINFGGPPLDLAPINRWKQLMLKQWSNLKDLEWAAYTVEPFGYAPLREAIAAYLHRFRAVRCGADQVVVFGTKPLRLDAVARVLLNPGDAVAFEEPGFPGAKKVLLPLGVHIVPIPVDRHGLVVEALMSRPEKFKLVYVTPSHQDPTAVTLPLERRLQLLDWAQGSGAFIIEDDYDSEYRYGGKPLPSLQGLDRGDCVIYFGSLWTVLFHVMRFGYIVVPNCLRDVIWQAKMHLERYMPVVEQLALTDFINEGYLENYIKKTQLAYGKRRQALIYCLTRYMGSRTRIGEESGGMHLLVHINTSASEKDIIESAAKAGIAMMSTTPFYLGKSPRGEFMMPFSSVDTEQIASKIQHFAQRISERETARC